MLFMGVQWRQQGLSHVFPVPCALMILAVTMPDRNLAEALIASSCPAGCVFACTAALALLCTRFHYVLQV